MDKKKSKLINLLKKFKKENNIDRMFLFGSMAYGKPNKWSDIDLIIVSKKFKNKGILKRAPELYLKWNIDYPVDFLCYTPEEFKTLSKRISIVSEAVKNGIEL